MSLLAQMTMMKVKGMRQHHTLINNVVVVPSATDTCPRRTHLRYRFHFLIGNILAVTYCRVHIFEVSEKVAGLFAA